MLFTLRTISFRFLGDISLICHQWTHFILFYKNKYLNRYYWMMIIIKNSFHKKTILFRVLRWSYPISNWFMLLTADIVMFTHLLSEANQNQLLRKRIWNCLKAERFEKDSHGNWVRLKRSTFISKQPRLSFNQDRHSEIKYKFVLCKVSPEISLGQN